VGCQQEFNYISKRCREQGCQMVYFQTKNPIWVNIGGSCNERCWQILRPICIFYSHQVFFMAIGCILLPFGIFLQFWYIVAGKIWQPWSRIRGAVVKREKRKGD
jgi:hypothetical protein